MTSIPFRPVLLGLALAVAGVEVARADCESDMLQLADAMRAPNQTPAVQAAFKEGAGKAASAMRKDDDDTCRKVIAEALAKAGKTLK